MPRGTSKKWKTTRKAALAAEQKAVESTAAPQERDQESREQAQEVPREYSAVKIQKEEILARAVHSALTDHVAHLAKALTDHADLSERVLKDLADHLEKALSAQEEVLARDAHLAATDHAVHSERDVRSVKALTDREEASEKAVHSEATEEVADSEELARRA